MAALDDVVDGVDVPTLGARVGYAGKALLYLALGVLIGRLALGDPSQDTSAEGAIDAIAQQPFGTALLIALTIGLAAHGAHGLWAARGNNGNDGWHRISGILRGLIYLGLAALAAKQALFSGASGSGSSTGASMTARVLEWPAGPWIVAAVGVGIAIAGVRILHRAITAEWHDEFERHHVSATEHRVILRAGQVGHVARGIAYLLVAGFVAYAALRHDPNKGGGLDAALGEVTQASFAPLVLFPLAVGMLAFALFAAMMARYVSGE